MQRQRLPFLIGSLYSARPSSRALRDSTHAVEVNCILLSKAQYLHKYGKKELGWNSNLGQSFTLTKTIHDLERAKSNRRLQLVLCLLHHRLIRLFTYFSRQVKNIGVCALNSALRRKYMGECCALHSGLPNAGNSVPTPQKTQRIFITEPTLLLHCKRRTQRHDLQLNRTYPQTL